MREEYLHVGLGPIGDLCVLDVERVEVHGEPVTVPGSTRRAVHSDSAAARDYLHTMSQRPLPVLSLLLALMRYGRSMGQRLGRALYF